MYDRNKTAEILGDLRHELKSKFGKVPSFSDLSKDIKKVTGEYISHASLNDYENTEKKKFMSAKNLVVLAEYYGVSYDYLLGRSSSRERENINVNQKYGLSDETLSRLEILKNTPKKDFEMSLIETLNLFIESDEFGSFIDTLAQCKYAHKARENGLTQNEESMKEVISTLTDEQMKLCKEGKMILVQPMKYYDILLSTLQNTITSIANDISQK